MSKTPKNSEKQTTIILTETAASDADYNATKKTLKRKPSQSETSETESKKKKKTEKKVDNEFKAPAPKQEEKSISHAVEVSKEVAELVIPWNLTPGKFFANKFDALSDKRVKDVVTIDSREVEIATGGFADNQMDQEKVKFYIFFLQSYFILHSQLFSYFIFCVNFLHFVFINYNLG